MEISLFHKRQRQDTAGGARISETPETHITITFPAGATKMTDATITSTAGTDPKGENMATALLESLRDVRIAKNIDQYAAQKQERQHSGAGIASHQPMAGGGSSDVAAAAGSHGCAAPAPIKHSEMQTALGSYFPGA